MKIAIDPGHGMSNRVRNLFDPGATHTEANIVFRESDIVLKYGLTLKEILTQHGHEVFMTRDDDTDHAPVGERAANAEQMGCGLFISLHMNDADDDTANGLEVLFRGDDDQEIAQAIQDSLIGVTGFRDRGIKRRTDLAVLKFNGKAVLIELGFIAHDGNRTALLNPATRSAICSAIHNVIDRKVGGGNGNVVVVNGGSVVPPATVPTARVTPPPGDTLTIRSAPRLNARAIGALQAGAIVELHATSGIWRRISPVEERWVSSRFLTPVGSGGGMGGGSATGLDQIKQIAANSAIARFNWPQRGVAPLAYIKGMALVFGRVYCKLQAGDEAAVEMAKAETGDAQRDALTWYHEKFAELGLSNNVSGADTLRHLFVLMLGLGMRESSGKHCTGRDTTASNTTADTAEAGLFQASFNARSCSPILPRLFQRYRSNPLGFLEVFSENVTCSTADHANFGSGDGKVYQQLAKECPAFAAEFAGVALRNLRKHWGPINRREVLLKQEADDLFRQVQTVIDRDGLCPLLA